LSAKIEFGSKLFTNEFCNRDVPIATVEWIRRLAQVIHETIVESRFPLILHGGEYAISFDLLYERSNLLLFLGTNSFLFFGFPRHSDARLAREELSKHSTRQGAVGVGLSGAWGGGARSAMWESLV
jgi:hypothetical protein